MIIMEKTKEQQSIVEKYLVKYLASYSLEQEMMIRTRQLYTLNNIIVERGKRKK